MTDGRRNLRWGAVLAALAVLACADLARAQLPTSVTLPSQVVRPSQALGYLGGRYTNSSPGTGYLPPSFDASNYTSPLVRSLAPTGLGRPGGLDGNSGLDGTGGGLRAYESMTSPAALPPSLIRPFSAIGQPLAQPMAQPIGQDSVPGHGPLYRPHRIDAFEPTVTADTFNKAYQTRRVASLDAVSLVGPSASAVEPPRPAPEASPKPNADFDSLRKFTQRHSAQQSTTGEACLARAIEALRSGQLRSDKTNKGAIDLFRQARLLLTDKPEPTLGLIASLVATADYNQAAVLVGPLARRWPAVLAEVNFGEQYYARPEQMRAHLLAIRDAAVSRGDPDLRVLWAFYRWYVENRLMAAADVEQMARTLSPDSPSGASSAALAAAMRAALEGGS